VAAHGGAEEPPPGFELGGDPTAGRKIYKQYCKKCHGKKGNGTGLMAKDLNPKPADFTDKVRMEKRSDWQLFLGIKAGGPAVGLSEQMTGWKDTLTEQEMRDVAAYIRQFAK
jgi:mono/diheme cytochrome c family protein